MELPGKLVAGSAAGKLCDFSAWSIKYRCLDGWVPMSIVFLEKENRKSRQRKEPEDAEPPEICGDLSTAKCPRQREILKKV